MREELLEESVWKRFSSFYELLLSLLKNLLSRVGYTPRFRDLFCFLGFLLDQQSLPALEAIKNFSNCLLVSRLCWC